VNEVNCPVGAARPPTRLSRPGRRCREALATGLMRPDFLYREGRCDSIVKEPRALAGRGARHFVAVGGGYLFDFGFVAGEWRSLLAVQSLFQIVIFRITRRRCSSASFSRRNCSLL
jgi:hypothetical protein